MKNTLLLFFLLFSLNQIYSQCVNTCSNTPSNFTTVHCESFELPPSSINNLTSFFGWFNLDDNNGFFNGFGNNSNSSIKMCNFGTNDVARSEVILDHPYPNDVSEVIISFDIFVDQNTFGNNAAGIVWLGETMSSAHIQLDFSNLGFLNISADCGCSAQCGNYCQNYNLNQWNHIEIRINRAANTTTISRNGIPILTIPFTYGSGDSQIDFYTTLGFDAQIGTFYIDNVCQSYSFAACDQFIPQLQCGSPISSNPLCQDQDRPFACYTVSGGLLGVTYDATCSSPNNVSYTWILDGLVSTVTSPILSFNPGNGDLLPTTVELIVSNVCGQSSYREGSCFVDCSIGFDATCSSPIIPSPADISCDINPLIDPSAGTPDFYDFTVNPSFSQSTIGASIDICGITPSPVAMINNNGILSYTEAIPEGCYLVCFEFDCTGMVNVQGDDQVAALSANCPTRFCKTFCVNPETNCTDAATLDCNTTGLNGLIIDSTTPNDPTAQGAGFFTTPSTFYTQHALCIDQNAGCETDNLSIVNTTFENHEVNYVYFPTTDDLGKDLVFDLFSTNIDHDVFAYRQCNLDGSFSACIARSNRSIATGGANRESIIIKNLVDQDPIYFVVDVETNTSGFPDGVFTASLTCGDICDKVKTISCGQTITANTIGSGNQASQYCNTIEQNNAGASEIHHNWGPEDIYRFDLLDSSTVSISLNADNAIDLELYLLDNCDPCSSGYSSRNPDGNETISRALSPGTYYIVVEGFRGEQGAYSLSVNGCSNTPVTMNNCTEINSENFDQLQDGDQLPTDDLTNRWAYGFTYSDDIIDNSLDGEIENINGTNQLVFNSGNYNFQNALMQFDFNDSGIEKISWELTTQYVSGELYGGVIRFADFYLIQDFTQGLEIELGNNGQGNVANLNYVTGSLFGVTTTTLAEIDVIKNYSGSAQNVSFLIDLVYDISKSTFTLMVEGTVVYTGIYNSNFDPLSPFRYLEFATDDNQDYMAIDNISHSRCEDCEIEYDDTCSFISPVSFTPNGPDRVAISLAQSGIDPGDILSYRLTNEDTNETIELSNLSYANCIPGNSYRFCIIYQELEDSCPKACCFRISIPLNCSFFTPFYTGDDSNIEYTYTLDNPDPTLIPQDWYVDGINNGASNSVSIPYSGSLESFVCYLFLNPVTGQYILCCQRICVTNAIDCSDVIIDYQPSSDTYALSVANATDIISWQIDLPQNLPNGNIITDPLNFDPTSYEIVNVDEILVSVRYRDSKGCIKVCCRRLCLVQAQGSSCNTFTATQQLGDDYILSFLDPSTVDFSTPVLYDINGDSEVSSSSNSTTVNLSDYLGQTIRICCYYRTSAGCWQVCCRAITVAPPQDAVLFDISDNCGPVGSTISIPITTRNFENVLGFGFTINSSDPSSVAIRDLVNINNEVINTAYNVINDMIIIGWDDASGSVKSLPDNTRLFDLELEIISDFNGEILLTGSDVEVFGLNLSDGIILQGTVCVDDAFSISGEILTEDGKAVSAIDVFLNGDDLDQTSSDTNGNYSFDQILSGNYTIDAINDENLRQGVTISDVALIRSHFLQIQQLSSDYKMIAADLNRNGQITISDVALARAIFLQTITSLSNNDSWRFIPEALDISSNPLDPNLDQRITLDNLASTQDNLDFVAVKVGDVNNSVLLKQEDIYDNKRLSTSFSITDTMVVVSDEIVIPVQVSDFNNILLFGFELSWDFDLLEFVEIRTDKLEAFSEQNYNQVADKLIVGWDQAQSQGVDIEDGALIELVFKSVGSKIGETELVFNNLEVLDGSFEPVQIVSDNGTVTVGTSSVSQLDHSALDIFPNPFSDYVTISASSSVKIYKVYLYDSKGALVSEQSQSLETNELRLDTQSIGPSGLYFLKAMTSDGLITVKLIKN